MAIERLPSRLRANVLRKYRSPTPRHPGASCRAASTLDNTPNADEEPSASSPFSDLGDSSLYNPGPSPEQIATYDPVGRSRARTTQLPPSRYQFRPPKYFRGPLHPHQPPPSSSPASRLYIPGPFTLPRLLQTYESTLAPDLMTLYYKHQPPNTPTPPVPQRLRSWNPADSPYFGNRPLRGPRGAPHLPLLAKPITFRNVPRLQRITVSATVPEAQTDSAHLHVAGMVLQAITGVRAEVKKARRSMAAGRTGFQQSKGKPIAVTARLEGEGMWDFCGRVVEVVLPTVKEWPGVSGRSGDGSGNLGFGLGSEVVGGWPEVEVNYDSYPPKMIPAIDIILHTTATNDRDARLMLSALGFPFYGKHRN